MKSLRKKSVLVEKRCIQLIFPLTPEGWSVMRTTVSKALDSAEAVIVDVDMKIRCFQSSETGKLTIVHKSPQGVTHG